MTQQAASSAALRAEAAERPQLDVTIILPVYNEAEHLREEINRIRAAMDASEYSYETIVVDDGPADGAGVARQYIRPLPAGFSCVTTMTMTFLSGGYSVKYIPIDYAKRAGESKFHPIKDTRRYGTQVVRMVLSYSPLRIFLPVGFALLTL